jgi:hypothetical protein
MPPMSSEQREALYKKITICVGQDKGLTQLDSIDRIMVEIARRLVSEFGALALEENKDALLLAVELRFDELTKAIVRHHFDESDKEAEAKEANRRACQKLVELKVTSAAELSWRDGLPW